MDHVEERLESDDKEGPRERTTLEDTGQKLDKEVSLTIYAYVSDIIGV